VPDFLHNDDLNERERLVAFVPFVHEVLDGAVRNARFEPTLVNPLRQAWKELEETQEFGRLETAVRDAALDKIRGHGLSGQQFEYKRQVVRRWYDRYTQRPIARLVHRLLDVVDNVLDSLIDVTGVGGAIKEFKEAIAGSLEDDE
jgi:hypothetical protein